MLDFVLDAVSPAINDKVPGLKVLNLLGRHICKQTTAG